MASTVSVLAVAAPDLPVRPGHLDHVNTFGGQVPGECGAVAAGPLDTDSADLAEAAQPVEQLPVASCGGAELSGAQECAERVQGGRDVHVEVRVDAARDETCGCCESGQVRPSVRAGQGGHARRRADSPGTGPGATGSY